MSNLYYGEQKHPQNKMNKLLTIAIPAYNMENYLSRCLDSLLGNPNIEDYLEIIIVNDGSKDCTLTIAQNYAAKHSCIVLIDKPNGGWGSAINVAINKAQGKYFKILDSDDWFNSNALSDYISLLTHIEDTDLIATSFSYEYADGTSKDDSYETELCNRRMLFKDYLQKNHYKKHLPMATLTFKTSILKDNQIQVCDRYYADIDYNLTPLIFVNTIYFTQINLYKYFIGREGQSTSIEGYSRHLNDFILVCKKLVSFYHNHQNHIEETVRNCYLLDTCNVVRFAYDLLMSPTYNKNTPNHKNILKSLDAFIKSQSPELYKMTNQLKKRSVPYIYIWRKTGINLLKFRK